MYPFYPLPGLYQYFFLLLNRIFISYSYSAKIYSFLIRRHLTGMPNFSAISSIVSSLSHSFDHRSSPESNPPLSCKKIMDLHKKCLRYTTSPSSCCDVSECYRTVRPLWRKCNILCILSDYNHPGLISIPFSFIIVIFL